MKSVLFAETLRLDYKMLGYFLSFFFFFLSLFPFFLFPFLLLVVTGVQDGVPWVSSGLGVNAR